MLTKLEIRSFKGFAEADLELQPFTLLVGPNGSGKSTVLQAVELMGALVTSTLTDHLRRHEWDYADLTHLRATSSRIGLVAHLTEGQDTFSWEINLESRRYPGIASEKVTRTR